MHDALRSVFLEEIGGSNLRHRSLREITCRTLMVNVHSWNSQHGAPRVQSHNTSIVLRSLYVKTSDFTVSIKMMMAQGVGKIPVRLFPARRGREVPK